MQAVVCEVDTINHTATSDGSQDVLSATTACSSAAEDLRGETELVLGDGSGLAELAITTDSVISPDEVSAMDSGASWGSPNAGTIVAKDLASSDTNQIRSAP